MRARPIVSIVFDDNSDTHYSEAFIRMRALDLVGCNYIIAKNIGGSNLTTQEELEEMYAAGWDISNHTFQHRDLQNETDSEVVSQVSQAFDRLEERGFERGKWMFLAPFNHIDDHVRSLISSYCRYITNENQGYNNIPFNPLYVNRKGGGGETVAEIKSWVDDVIANNQYLHLNFHHISNTVGGLHYPTDDFQEVMEYIAEKRDEGAIEVMTCSAVTAELTRSTATFNGEITLL